MGKVEMKGVAEWIESDFTREIGGSGYYDFFHRKVAEKARSEAEKLLARPPILPGDVLRLGGNKWMVTEVNPAGLFTSYPIGDGLARLVLDKKAKEVVEVEVMWGGSEARLEMEGEKVTMHITTRQENGSNLEETEVHQLGKMEIVDKLVVPPEQLYALACLRVASREKERWRRALTPIVVIAGLSLVEAVRVAGSSSGSLEVAAAAVMSANFFVVMAAWGVEIRYSNLVEEYLNRPEVRKLRGLRSKE